MKATLEFDLSDHDDKLAHKRAVESTSAYIALFEIREYLRRMHKYGENDISDIYAGVCDIISNNVNMDDLE